MDIHDQLYLQADQDHPFLLQVWQPQDLAVVIGYGQKAELEARLDRCRRDRVPVIRRRGGGGAVVLMPGMLCISCAFISQLSDSPYYFFNSINQFLVDLLKQEYAVQNLLLRGISDIALNEKKILGCSMFKSRHLYFYQGSLLVNPALWRMALYLAHPSREPDYRQGRPHDEFVTSLWEGGYQLDLDELAAQLVARQETLSARLLAGFKKEISAEQE